MTHSVKSPILIYIQKGLYSSPRTKCGSQYNQEQKLNMKPFQIHFCILHNILRLKNTMEKDQYT